MVCPSLAGKSNLGDPNGPKQALFTHVRPHITYVICMHYYLSYKCVHICVYILYVYMYIDTFIRGKLQHLGPWTLGLGIESLHVDVAGLDVGCFRVCYSGCLKGVSTRLMV